MTTVNLFSGTPAAAADSDASAVNLSTEFYVTTTAWLTKVRFFQGTGTINSQDRTAALYSTTDGSSGTKVGGDWAIPAPLAGVWGTFTLPTPLQLTANTRYRIVIRHLNGRYAATGGYFMSGGAGQTTTTLGGFLVLPNNADARGNDQGAYGYAGSIAFPVDSFNGGCYYSDVEVTDVNPAGGATAHPLAGTVAATSTAVGSFRANASLAATAAVTSATTGAFQAKHPLAGTTAAVSGTTGAINKPAYPLSGVAAATSATSGTISAVHPLAGVASAISATTGTINLVGGAQSYPLSGSVAAVTTTTGTIQATFVLAGTVAAVSATTGTIGLVGGAQSYPLAGTAVAVSATSGTIGIGVAVITGRPKVYVGGAWQGKPAKANLGAGWVEKPMKRWDGSQWKALT